MAFAVEDLVVSPGINAGSPFALGDVLYVAQVSPAIAASTPDIFVDTSAAPQQIEIGPLAATPHATVIGHLATVPAGGLGNQVVIGTSATTTSTQDDVVIGHAASTSGGGAVAIGVNAAANAGANAGAVAVGTSATVTSVNGVAIGPAASCAGQVAIGPGAVVNGAFGIAIGSATANLGAGHGNGSIAIGRGANAGESTDIVIGTGTAGTPGGGGGNILLASGVGGAGAQGHDSIVIGSSSNSGSAFLPASATAGGVFSTVLGGNSQAQHSGARLFGRGLTSTVPNQTLIGGTDDPCAICVFGNGSTAAVPQSVTLGVTGGSGANVNGATLSIAGGIATGNGVGGSMVFETSIVGGASSTPQVLGTALTIDNTQTCIFANPAKVTNTAVGAANAGTLTNLPAAASAGDPQAYLTFKNGTHTYAVPAWQIA